MQGIGLVGNLTDTPSVTTTSGGKQVARFTLAINDGYRAVDGSWTARPPVFQKCESWNDAVAAGEWPKGALVVCVGSLRSDTYEVDGPTGKEQRRAQWFAADVAALVPRTKAGLPDLSAAADDPDDPYSAAR